MACARVMEKSLWRTPISLMLFFQLAIAFFFFFSFTGYIYSQNAASKKLQVLKSRALKDFQ
jgi:hypothetical protein